MLPLPPGGKRGRLSIIERNVPHKTRAQEAAFQKVVAEHGVLRDPISQCGTKNSYIKNSLAAEDSRAENILIKLACGGRVKIHAAFPAHQARKRRFYSGGKRLPHARGNHAMALTHYAVPIGQRAVKRMLHRTDALCERARRQDGVRVKREAVAHLFGERRADEHKRPVLPHSKQLHQVGERAAFAFTPHIYPVKTGKFPLAVQEKKDGSAVLGIAVV